jgi:hypothetical protein
MKTAILSLALGVIGSIGSAEVGRRDALFAVGFDEPTFHYTIDSSVGRFTGSDSFTSDVHLRGGGRWALAEPGSSIAPLLGADLLRRDAALDNGGLTSFGIAGTFGGTWATSERMWLDGEAWYAIERTELTLSPGGSGNLSASGDGTAKGLRARLLYTPIRRWTYGLEAGVAWWDADLSADQHRSVSLEGSGWTTAIVIAWRPAARPTSLE